MNRRTLRFLALLLTFVGSAVAQIAVRNSASYWTPGLPGSGIAQGAIFSIFGTGLGPTTAAYAALPLSTELGGTTVNVTVGGVTTNAVLIYVQDRQINAVMPSATPTGTGTVTVNYGGTSQSSQTEVVTSAFGIYTFTSSGSGQAVASLYPSYQPNTVARAFHPGDTVILWGTGLGAIKGDDSALPPPQGDLPASIKVHVGNSLASVTYQGRSGCCAGLDQINFTVPSDVTGCYVPVAVEIEGAISNTPTIAVTQNGRTCTDSVIGPDLLDKIAAGQTVNFGYIRLESIIAPVGGGQAGFGSNDSGFASFSAFNANNAGAAEYGVSPGYCIVRDCPNGCDPGDISPAQLDAGPSLSIQGPSTGSMPGFGGYYYAFLSGTARFLWSGSNYTVSGIGGSAVGSFTVMSRSSLAAVAFQGIRASQTLPRSGDLTLQWTGSNPTLQNGNVTIGGYSLNDDQTKWVWLRCVAPEAAHSFTIPGWVLAALPPSGTVVSGSLTYPQGWLWIGQYNTPTEFKPDGLNRGVFTDIFYNGLAIYFR